MKLNDELAAQIITDVISALAALQCAIANQRDGFYVLRDININSVEAKLKSLTDKVEFLLNEGSVNGGKSLQDE